MLLHSRLKDWGIVFLSFILKINQKQIEFSMKLLLK